MVSYTQTGNLQSGLESAGVTLLSEVAFASAGAMLKGAPWEVSSFVHGGIGGGINAIEGGSFKDGFIANAVSDAMSGPISQIGKNAKEFGVILARGAAAGIVGGTVAAATGGNWENGAATAALGNMFNTSLDEDGNPIANIKEDLETFWDDNAWQIEGDADALSDGGVGATIEGAEDVGRGIQVGVKEINYFYHYTRSEYANNIMQNGLRQSGDGFVYTTTKGNLQPLQAQIELALSPNRRLPDALIRIDMSTLQNMGIKPVIGPRYVSGGDYGIGGAKEILFDQPIPPSALTRIR